METLGYAPVKPSFHLFRDSAIAPRMRIRTVGKPGDNRTKSGGDDTNPDRRSSGSGGRVIVTTVMVASIRRRDADRPAAARRTILAQRPAQATGSRGRPAQ